jgi:phenylacetate-coenzyme A ligase PaaK-like adenylate-forming protein
MHHERCACGNPSPWLTVEGRTDDVLTFISLNGPVKVAPLPVYATLKEVEGLRRYQLVALGGNRIELRIEPAPGFTQNEAFDRAKIALSEYLKSHDISDLAVTLSKDAPRQLTGSGKFKHILNQSK